MFVGQCSNYGACDGLAKGEERTERAAKENNVVAVIDWSGKGVLVCVQKVECICEDRRRCWIGVFCVLYAVELEQLWEKRKDEGEGYL